MWTMKNAPICTNAALIQTLHRSALYFTPTVEFTQNHNFQNTFILS